MLPSEYVKTLNTVIEIDKLANTIDTKSFLEYIYNLRDKAKNRGNPYSERAVELYDLLGLVAIDIAVLRETYELLKLEKTSVKPCLICKGTGLIYHERARELCLESGTCANCKGLGVI